MKRLVTAEEVKTYTLSELQDQFPEAYESVVYDIGGDQANFIIQDVFDNLDEHLSGFVHKELPLEYDDFDVEPTSGSNGHKLDVSVRVESMDNKKLFDLFPKGNDPYFDKLMELYLEDDGYLIENYFSGVNKNMSCSIKFVNTIDGIFHYSTKEQEVCAEVYKVNQKFLTVEKNSDGDDWYSVTQAFIDNLETGFLAVEKKLDRMLGEFYEEASAHFDKLVNFDFDELEQIANDACEANGYVFDEEGNLV